jgi:hypothetical protein
MSRKCRTFVAGLMKLSSEDPWAKGIQPATVWISRKTMVAAREEGGRRSRMCRKAEAGWKTDDVEDFRINIFSLNFLLRSFHAIALEA